VPEILAVLAANAGRARDLLRRSVPLIGSHPDRCASGCDRALDSAVVTDPASRDPALWARLDAVTARLRPADPGTE
jgi:5'-methylthioadenosine phosphorylase